MNDCAQLCPYGDTLSLSYANMEKFICNLVVSDEVPPAHEASCKGAIRTEVRIVARGLSSGVVSPMAAGKGRRALLGTIAKFRERSHHGLAQLT